MAMIIRENHNMRLFIIGGTGLIGTRLIKKLIERGDKVSVLTRRFGPARDRLGKDCTIVEGDGMANGKWMDALHDCDGVINLVGESIFARRWNDEFKILLRESRVKTTRNVVEAMARNPRTPEGKPKVLVNASAIGYYGPRGDEEIREETSAGDDMLARLSVDWEKAALDAELFGMRVAVVRIGVVLDKEGGALAQMLPPFRWFIGGPVGSGKQWLSWIHHGDMVGILMLALDHPEARGPINGTAPLPVTNKDFSKALGRALHRPSILPVPGFALRLKFGEVADVLTTGQRVIPRKAMALGYSFQFPQVDAALVNLLS